MELSSLFQPFELQNSNRGDKHSIAFIYRSKGPKRKQASYDIMVTALMRENPTAKKVQVGRLGDNLAIMIGSKGIPVGEYSRNNDGQITRFSCSSKSTIITVFNFFGVQIPENGKDASIECSYEKVSDGLYLLNRK